MLHEAPTPLSYNIPALSAAIGISKSSIFKLMREGKIRPFRIAGRTLFSHAEVTRIIADACATSNEKSSRLPVSKEEGQ